MEVRTDMVKVGFVLLAVTCLLTVTMTSQHAVPLGEAKVPYPACNKVPSWNLKGQFISIYKGTGDQSVSGASYVRDWYRLKDWSTAPSEEQKAWLSGTLEYLFIDAKPVTLNVDICYDQTGAFYGKTSDTVYKVFYLAIPAKHYSGGYDFFSVGFWEGKYDWWNDMTVTFS
jgi:hypothetical protein